MSIRIIDSKSAKIYASFNVKHVNMYKYMLVLTFVLSRWKKLRSVKNYLLIRIKNSKIFLISIICVCFGVLEHALFECGVSFILFIRFSLYFSISFHVRRVAHVSLSWCLSCQVPIKECDIVEPNYWSSKRKITD